jgi:threonyl-tRNA synthetase
MRVRGFVQDDAHIFCTEDQVQAEAGRFIDLLQKVYADFGFTDILIKLSTRPAKRIGSDEAWDRAEAALAASLDAKGLPWEANPGEGAFYGPKIEFSLKDSIGRVWQCGTLQLDFALPGRLGAEYVAEDNTRKVPVMLHRAVLGSLERFIGILIENHAGAMPLWLSPVQAVVMNISEHQGEYATQLAAKLRAAGIRCDSDLRNEKITYKIREHSVAKVPYLLVVGEKELASGRVAVRARGNRDLGAIGVDEVISLLRAEIDAKAEIKAANESAVSAQGAEAGNR